MFITLMQFIRLSYLIQFVFYKMSFGYLVHNFSCNAKVSMVKRKL